MDHERAEWKQCTFTHRNVHGDECENDKID